MKAALYYGKEDIRIQDVPEPPTKPGYIKVSPAFVGICGTDLHEYLGGPTFAPTSPHPVTGDAIPITLGHEFSGVVAEIGDGAENPLGLRPGQHVVVQPTVACADLPEAVAAAAGGAGGEAVCGACKMRVENCCYKSGFIGLSGGGGGLSKAVVVPPNRVIPLPDGIGLDIGALVEPLAVAWHAVSAPPAAVKPDDVALVLGGGPIGLAVLQVLRARGVRTVYVAEVAAQRQAFARSFGAAGVVDPSSEDVVKEMLKVTGGRGADVVWDCAGVPASLTTACTAVRAHGTVVNVAIWEKAVPFNPNMLVFREAKYVAVLGYLKKDFEAVIAALGDGSLRPARMITSKIRMEDLVDGGFKALIHDKAKHVKILVDVNAE